MNNKTNNENTNHNMNNKTNNENTKLNHLGKPFSKRALPGHPLRRFSRAFARRMWRESFGAKVIWRNSRHAGSDCSFRIFTGRCAA